MAALLSDHSVFLHCCLTTLWFCTVVCALLQVRPLIFTNKVILVCTKMSNLSVRYSYAPYCTSSVDSAFCIRWMVEWVSAFGLSDNNKWWWWMWTVASCFQLLSYCGLICDWSNSESPSVSFWLLPMFCSAIAISCPVVCWQHKPPNFTFAGSCTPSEYFQSSFLKLCHYLVEF